jgi:hypothetical protein
MKTILELQEELERVIPKAYRLNIRNYNPRNGGYVDIKRLDDLHDMPHRIHGFKFQTMTEALDKSVEWFKTCQ